MVMLWTDVRLGVLMSLVAPAQHATQPLPVIVLLLLVLPTDLIPTTMLLMGVKRDVLP